MTTLQRSAAGQFCLLIAMALCSATSAADWSIPVAGNAYRTAPDSEGQQRRRTRALAWSDSDEVYSVFFHVDRRADLELSVNVRPDGNSTLVARVGETEFQSSVDDSLPPGPVKLGRLQTLDAGYVRVDFSGTARSGATYGTIRDVLVSSSTDDLKLDYVKSNEGNMFYWGRRGPSVHLRYEVPKDPPLQYAYSEITVPVGQDPIGSFFMANGFGEGYFGFQVNGVDERRVLFSVWSPFRTDNPRDIPEDQRIVTLGHGEDVHVGEFGNEGSGGQSYLVFPWKAGTTYRFLTEVKPNGKGSTEYTSWFGDKSAGKWQLIASFRRPKTDTHLRGFHSFLESFNPALGHIGRRAQYGNVWVCDVEGTWHECTRARFSVDATGRGRHRLDFQGGAAGEQFFLRNCGFFNQTGRPGESFTRDSTAEQQPEIDFKELPRG